MVSKLTKNSILQIKKTIEKYGDEMKKLQEKINAIDEKYRKMAEEARRDLATEYANLEFEQNIWQTSLSQYADDVVNEVIGDASSTDEETVESESTATEPEEQTVQSATEEEAVIVDSIFPENNEEETTESAPMEEGSSSPEAKDLEEIWPEQAESIKVEDAPEEITEDVEAEADKAQAEDNEWPEFPQEW